MSGPGSKSRPLESLITISTDQVGPWFAIRQITGLFYFKEPTLFLRFISRNLTIPA